MKIRTILISAGLILGLSSFTNEKINYQIEKNSISGLEPAVFTDINIKLTNPSLEDRARSAARGCLKPFHSGEYKISSEVREMGICLVKGFLNRVYLYATPVCKPSPCSNLTAELIATVDFGCDNEVLGVTCY
jgi:hypothetical protein